MVKVNINIAVKILTNTASIGELITADCASVVCVGTFTAGTLTICLECSINTKEILVIKLKLSLFIPSTR
jgi:hypothetical protein